MNETESRGSRVCAVCGSNSKRLLCRQRFFTLSSGSLLDGYDVVACCPCGFCFADNIPEQEVFDIYYREMSKYEHQDQGGALSEYDLARFEAIASVIRPYIGDRQTRIQEIGCATGHLLFLLKQSGYENVMGIDPSSACAEAAQRLYGIRVTANTLSDMAVDDQAVDFLILVGVLEHVRELSPALAGIRKMLSPGGRVFISVPDASRYAEGEDAPFQEFSVEHINFFGPLSLANLMRANGFSQVDCQQSVVQANCRTMTPVIHAVFGKEDSVSTEMSLVPDTQTEAGLSKYIERSRQVDEHVRAVIADVAASGRPIIVWGTGTHTLRLLATSRLAEAKISAFVDSNSRYQGKQLNGIPIIAPAELKSRKESVVISSRVYQAEIGQQIRDDLRCSNELVLLYPDVGA